MRRVEVTQWEYDWLPLSSDSESSMRRMNSMGEQGWELVCVVENRAIFKRPRVTL